MTRRPLGPIFVATLLLTCVTLARNADALLGIGDSPRSELAPLPADEVTWSHAPYEAGQCAICHESSDPKRPGKVTGDVNELCFGCHEELQDAFVNRSHQHAAVAAGCTSCHNPHNAGFKKLLLDSAPGLCFRCHADIQDVAMNSVVKHGAILSDKACLNCHNPHATNVEKLLVQLPFDLCVSCHGTDGLRDENGTALANIKAVLDENPVHHGPIEAKDCSACHQTHGSANFRLLVQPYPAKFYDSYRPENYALCYTCHNDEIMASAETTSLTKFRDGSTNLHYKHVRKDERGRTCRACHEVHASKKPHQIRDSVPYGKGGWLLPVNFQQNEDGGQCSQTCHQTKVYKNR